MESDGILLYRVGFVGDYIILELRRGKFFLFINLGKIVWWGFWKVWLLFFIYVIWCFYSLFFLISKVFYFFVEGFACMFSVYKIYVCKLYIFYFDCFFYNIDGVL